MDPLRTLHTVRHLKPRQVVDRVVRRFRGVPSSWPERDRYTLVSRPPEPPAGATHGWAGDAGFRFIGLTGAFQGPDRWRPPGLPRLWAYHLHYFRWLWGAPSASRLPAARDWLGSCPPGSSPGWEPYPLSIRIREWTEWLLSEPGVPEADRREIVASLAHQALALERQLEFHLLGNHLLENAITLCWAGLSLRGPSSERWLALGDRLLAAELPVQLLPDGAHDERSPMYQSLLCEALLRLAAVAAASEAPRAGQVGGLAREAGLRMLASLGRLVHPDGDFALVNDCALGEAAPLAALHRRFGVAEPPPVAGTWDLPAAGYSGWRGDGAYLVFDSGPIGPDHQPGHGHADTLAFELSSQGRRLVCDTGVGTYEPGAERAWDRGTAGHSTVEVDGRDQSELWGAFRCGRRARVVGRSVEGEDSGLRLMGEYEGPGKGLRDRVRHRREVRLATEGGRPVHLAFREFLRAAGGHEAVIRVHLAPGIDAQPEGGAWRLLDGSAERGRIQGDGLVFAEGRSPYHPAFGETVERVCLAARLPFRDALEASWTLRLGRHR